MASGFCESGAPGPDAGSEDDARVDAMPDAVEPVCLGTYIGVCVSHPTSSVTLISQSIDTSTSPMCASYTATPTVVACVIAGQSIQIPAGNTVTVTGSKPLILLATGSLTISGVLDGSSRGGSLGPAADTAPCRTDFSNPTTDAQGGGGWGGSFGGVGGEGGKSARDGSGGSSPSRPVVAALTGGCPGSAGANNDLGSGAGTRGASGGAMLLIARETIGVPGTVNASGGGGAGGEAGGGGGGGGSGGMIVLDAAIVDTSGRCFANGGGGGEGASIIDGGDGNSSTSPNAPGTGGGGSSVGGGNGGSGGFKTSGAASGASGTGATSTQGGSGGGGGGGGSVGVIKIFSPDPRNTTDPDKVSPPPS